MNLYQEFVEIRRFPLSKDIFHTTIPTILHYYLNFRQDDLILQIHRLVTDATAAQSLHEEKSDVFQ